MKKTTQKYKGLKVLLADDEPYYLEWLTDYLESKGIIVDYASTVDAAIDLLKSQSYRIIIADLNIPMARAPETYAIDKTIAYSSYPGLFIANVARNSGYRTRQVIIYSVFTSKQIEEAAARLYCTFLTKGHPDDLKKEVDEVLDYDPTLDKK